jgi:hypothetical protein
MMPRIAARRSSWHGLMPHWTRVQTSAPGSGLGASLEADKITLAHATLDFMRELHDVHTDLAHMRTRYPAFAALLDAAGRPAPGRTP